MDANNGSVAYYESVEKQPYVPLNMGIASSSQRLDTWCTPQGFHSEITKPEKQKMGPECGSLMKNCVKEANKHALYVLLQWFYVWLGDDRLHLGFDDVYPRR